MVLSVPVNRLVGAGFESFWLGKRLEAIWSMVWWHPNQSHDGYIEVLVNLGWIGVSLLAYLLITAYRNITSTLRRDPSAGSIELAFFLIAVISNITEAGFKMLYLPWIFLLMAIAAAARSRTVESQSKIAIGARDDSAEREAEFVDDAWGERHVESF
jgi:O-antigen ligase